MDLTEACQMQQLGQSQVLPKYHVTTRKRTCSRDIPLIHAAINSAILFQTSLLTGR